MSYARWSDDSDVYVFAAVGGYVECCGCILGDKWDFHSAAEIVAHLREHVAAGHTIPEHLLDPSLYPDDDFEPYERVLSAGTFTDFYTGAGAGLPPMIRLREVESGEEQ